MATLSTAESELLEVVETMTMGESIFVVVNEINPGISRVAWCDSQAAVSILSNEGGSWRTRHLRVRASYARATIKEGNWLLHHLAGAQMVADIGTKVLTAARMEFLKNLLGMKGGFHRELQEQKNKKENESSSDGIDPNLILQAVRVLAIAAMLESADATRENEKNFTNEKREEEESEVELRWFLYGYTILVVVLTMLVRKFFRWFEPQISEGLQVFADWLGRGSLPVTPTSVSDDRPITKEEFQDFPLSHEEGHGCRGALPQDQKVRQVPQQLSDLPQGDGLKEGHSHVASRDSSSVSENQNSSAEKQGQPKPNEVSSSSSMMINIGGINLEFGDGRRVFRPMVTRRGTVYHTDVNCKYLKARGTGRHFEAQLCEKCSSVIQNQGRSFPQKGDILNGNPLSLARGTMIYHVDDGCNFRGPLQALTHCTVFSKK